MRYFIGLEEFNPNPVFDPSLFVEIRKRVGHIQFDQLTVKLMKDVSVKEKKKASKSETNKKGKDDERSNNDEPNNKGKIKIDTKVADQYITFPTDPGLLNECRENSEKMIDS